MRCIDSPFLSTIQYIHTWLAAYAIHPDIYFMLSTLLESWSDQAGSWKDKHSHTQHHTTTGYIVSTADGNIPGGNSIS